MALASQYLNEQNIAAVTHQILQYHNMGRDCIGEDYSSLPGDAAVRKLLNCVPDDPSLYVSWRKNGKTEL